MRKLRTAFLIVLFLFITSEQSESEELFFSRKDIFGNTLISLNEWAWYNQESRTFLMAKGFVKLTRQQQDSIMLHVNNKLYDYKKLVR